MNAERFRTVMNAVDDDLLEQAVRPAGKRPVRIHRFVAVAACLCIVVGLFWSRMTPHTLTEEDLLDAGYVLNLPEGAKNVVYALVDLGEAFSVPMAQATFVQDGCTYVCRVQKSEEPVDLLRSETEPHSTMDWSAAQVSLHLRQAAEGSSVSWYEPSTGTQWCLSSEQDHLALINTASQIIERLGYQMAVAPEGAQDIVYTAFYVSELTTAQTEFTVNGIRYAYRTAAALWLEDLTQKEIPGAVKETGTVLWCPAELYYLPGGEGKLLWYDVVPGLLYSLYMEDGASAENLMAMANEIFKPAQDNVG